MQQKFRQLPCRTFLSVGTCPYRERCVYLHDPRLQSRDARTRTRKKNKEDIVTDSLFWPVLAADVVAQKLDCVRQPHVVQVRPPPRFFLVLGPPSPNYSHGVLLPAVYVRVSATTCRRRSRTSPSSAATTKVPRCTSSARSRPRAAHTSRLCDPHVPSLSPAPVDNPTSRLLHVEPLLHDDRAARGLPF